MSTYRLAINESLSQLTIYLDGVWTLDEVKDYQKALVEYVKGRNIRTVLIDQSKAQFPLEAIAVFEENTRIPELKNTVTAAVQAPFLYEMMKSLPLQPGAPKPFLTVKEAESYLNTI